MAQLGEEFARLFRDEKIDKVLTVESSGIAPAVFTALDLDVPMVFARKKQSLTLSAETIRPTSSHSRNKKRIISSWISVLSMRENASY
ncbi:Xanthine phosphoribosyltransferase [Weissella viridescens]|uniref:Xanthine phosphoribosyltransferase n=1 Tax=Weissella viridescens TaxID=1629 RepID=A0A380P6H7_WEIVI|nr:Xanthine phosphoribosyltransferase [Weissella viridescens]